MREATLLEGTHLPRLDPAATERLIYRDTLPLLGLSRSPARRTPS